MAALAMVPTNWYVTYRLSGILDRLRKLDMEQRCKWIVYGTDGLGGKLRMHAHAPEVAPARSWASFSSPLCHGIVRHRLRPIGIVSLSLPHSGWQLRPVRQCTAVPFDRALGLLLSSSLPGVLPESHGMDCRKVAVCPRQSR